MELSKPVNVRKTLFRVTANLSFDRYRATANHDATLIVRAYRCRLFGTSRYQVMLDMIAVPSSAESDSSTRMPHPQVREIRLSGPLPRVISQIPRDLISIPRLGLQAVLMEIAKAIADPATESRCV